MKTWSVGEKLNASDLNANFLEALELNQSLVAGEALTALKPGYINPLDSLLYTSHGHKSISSNGVTMPGQSDFNDWVRLNNTQFMMLYYSANTLSIRIWDRTSGGAGSSQTVTTTFQSSSHNNNLTRASVSRIDDTHFIVFYTKTGTSTDQLYFRTGTISGGTITMDTETIFPSSPSYAYCVVSANGNADGKVILSFTAQSGGIGSISTLVHYIYALTCSQNSVTVNYSNSGTTVGSGSFWPSAAWNSVVCTDNGVGIAIMNAQDSGGYYSFYLSVIDSNNGATGNRSSFKPNTDTQGSNRYSNRPVCAAHDEQYIAAWQTTDSFTGGGMNTLMVLLADINGFNNITLHSEGDASSPTDAAATVRNIVGGTHGVIIPDEQVIYRKGRFINYPALAGSASSSSGRLFVTGACRDIIAYFDGSNVRSEYMATLFDGIIASTVSASAAVILYRNIAPGMSLTANRKYYLKNSFTTVGDITTSGTVPIGRAISASSLLVEK